MAEVFREMKLRPGEFSPKPKSAKIKSHKGSTRVRIISKTFIELFASAEDNYWQFIRALWRVEAQIVRIVRQLKARYLPLQVR